MPLRNSMGQFEAYQPAHGYPKRTQGAVAPDNPAYVHRMRAERALGKPLPTGAVVHHTDGSKRADAPLVICQDNAYLRLLHRRMKIRAAGGNPNTDGFCTRCKQVKPIEAFYPGKAARGSWEC